MAESVDERFGKSTQAEDLDDVRQEGADGFAERLVVVGFERDEFLVAGDERMFVGAVEQEAAFFLGVDLRRVHPVAGGEDAHLVATQTEVLHDGLAAVIIGAGVVRRIEAGQSENFHGARLTGRQGIGERGFSVVVSEFARSAAVPRPARDQPEH